MECTTQDLSITQELGDLTLEEEDLPEVDQVDQKESAEEDDAATISQLLKVNNQSIQEMAKVMTKGFQEMTKGFQEMTKEMTKGFQEISKELKEELITDKWRTNLHSTLILSVAYMRL